MTWKMKEKNEDADKVDAPADNNLKGYLKSKVDSGISGKCKKEVELIDIIESLEH